jgi:hypothetical protein
MNIQNAMATDLWEDLQKRFKRFVDGIGKHIQIYFQV